MSKKKTLATGMTEEAIAATIIRNATKRLIRRMTRSARKIRMILIVGPASVPIEPNETNTTKKSNQFQEFLQNSQNQCAVKLIASSIAKMTVNVRSMLSSVTSS